MILAGILPHPLDAEVPVAGTPSKYLRHEHNHLYATLERMAQTPGKTGKSAQQLLAVLRPHMIREERFVLPQLGLLKDLAFGRSTEGMLWAVKLSEELKKEYPQMISEHKAILRFTDELIESAKLEGDQNAVIYAEQLKEHLQDEADIVYPAAILAGEFIRSKR